ncbi:hypothetical protein CVT25_001157 [Psilocybe cyanescens]|uniref:Uncharacterized protein n=1 Tax=Psilocybe cyanescens TaxID=93625 RepID=A0A409XEH6_PSICY|nr:hypothetical protein CVT25_001157 [Psilocybe cyanescens]
MAVRAIGREASFLQDFSQKRSCVVLSAINGESIFNVEAEKLEKIPNKRFGVLRTSRPVSRAAAHVPSIVTGQQF